MTYFAGTRTIPSCLGTERYYDSIDSCVSGSIYTNSQFIRALTSQKVCPGGLIADYLALEALRNCEVITSSLIIAVADVDADYSALFFIREIQGLFIFMYYVRCLLISNTIFLKSACMIISRCSHSIPITLVIYYAMLILTVHS